MRFIAGLVCATVALAHAGPVETVVFDATGETPPAAIEPAQGDQDALVSRFPDAHARQRCTPDEQSKSTLLPHITTLTAAVTRARAAQHVYLIDYCPGGWGAPHTRRLLVLDGTAVVLDRELPASLPADSLIAATDLDRDGRAELVMTESAYRDHRIIDTVYVVRPGTKGLDILGVWPGVEHCSVEAGGDQILHRIVATGDGSTFRHTKVTRKCFYPPAAP